MFYMNVTTLFHYVYKIHNTEIPWKSKRIYAYLSDLSCLWESCGFFFVREINLDLEIRFRWLSLLGEGIFYCGKIAGDWWKLFSEIKYTTNGLSVDVLLLFSFFCLEVFYWFHNIQPRERGKKWKLDKEKHLFNFCFPLKFYVTLVM